MTAERAMPVCPCGCEGLTEVFAYREPPEGETRFPLQGDYFRRILRCNVCGHFVSRHGMDMGSLYAGAYVDSTYGNNMLRTFKHIVSLPPEKSDNEGRVRRVIEFAKSRFLGGTPSIMDVGSGLCVFLHRMKGEGWKCVALDPDPRAAAHARECIGVEAVCGNFEDGLELGRFQVITFNKVLEHVLDPVALLAKARRHLEPNGFVYVELPDGEGAWNEGFHREEFFIEHHHVFSMTSTAILATKSGLTCLSVERLREPSGKYTLRAFLVS